MPSSRKEPIRNERKALVAAFPKAYIQNGLNGTAAVKALKPHLKEVSARAEAPDILAIPSVRAEIQRLLTEQGLSVEEAVKIHKRNMQQSKHYPTSQKAVETVYQLNGLMDQEKTNSVQVGIIIER